MLSVAYDIRTGKQTQTHIDDPQGHCAIRMKTANIANVRKVRENPRLIAQGGARMKQEISPAHVKTILA